MDNTENETTSQVQERITSEGAAPNAFAPLCVLNFEAFMRDPAAVVYTAFHLSSRESGTTPSAQVLFEAGQNGKENK